jgi:hypothetical protein
MSDILKKLAGGDRRSIGRASEVVSDVLSDTSLFELVFEGMQHDDPVIRMRCADAVEKITATHPEHLQPYKHKLIEEVARSGQQEVRWHVAQMIPRLELSQAERAVAVDILTSYLNDKSKIVKTFAMQALADLAGEHADLRAQVSELLEKWVQTGSPAMKSRGRKLLAKLGRKA